MFLGFSQNFNLSNGNIIGFNKEMYCFGLNSNSAKAQLIVYKLDTNLKKIDSLSFELGLRLKNNFIPINADTLHAFLNIYLQEKNGQKVNILRIDKNFKLKVFVENIDIARLNNTSVLGVNYKIDKTVIYSIKSAIDSSGQNFFLNKYTLKTETENFDYNLIWQYPLERKNIQSVNIIYADSMLVYLMVSIYKGNKAGDWILKINSKNGQLRKAIRLNDKNETSYFMPAECLFNSGEKSLQLFGQKLNANQFNPNTQNLSIGTSSYIILYMTTIDSLGEIVNKEEFKLPINDVQLGGKKISCGFLIKISKVSKTNIGKIKLELDVFKNENGISCFYYTNSLTTFLSFDGEKHQMEKCSITPNLEIENYYRTKDKLNLNGKFCIDSVNEISKIYRAPFIMPVKIAYKTDDLLNGAWVLTKTETLKNQIELSVLALMNKVYQLKSIQSSSKNQNFKILTYFNNKIITGNQLDENNFQLSSFTW
jgi:hypothetical protein